MYSEHTQSRKQLGWWNWLIQSTLREHPKKNRKTTGEQNRWKQMLQLTNQLLERTTYLDVLLLYSQRALMIGVTSLLTVKTILMIAFILKFETMSGWFLSKSLYKLFNYTFFSKSFRNISGFSDRSILWATLGSGGAFTVVNILAEIIFKMANNQNQVHF